MARASVMSLSGMGENDINVSAPLLGDGAGRGRFPIVVGFFRVDILGFECGSPRHRVAGCRCLMRRQGITGPTLDLMEVYYTEKGGDNAQRALAISREGTDVTTSAAFGPPPHSSR